MDIQKDKGVKKIFGLVLAGGESTRAGTDKGLKRNLATTWVEQVFAKLRELGLETNISINAHQQVSYHGIFTEDKLIVDDNNIPGPLRGIVTAHRKFPQRNWMILPCDMIDMNLPVMVQLLECAAHHQGFEFYVFKNQHFFQPFCGIYTYAGLAKISNEIESGNCTDFSLQHVFKTYKTYELNMSVEEDQSFNNYNK